MRLWAPYAMALGGVMAITAAIGVITALASVQGLAALYLLLVLWLGARWGRGPAVAGSIGAFLFYDYFFVPPVGTLSVSGPAELLELFVLLAVALVTSQLAASMRRAQARAETLAQSSHALYELATAALRSSDVTIALSMLSRRALQLDGVVRFALVAIDVGQAVALAGDPTADEMSQAAWVYENGRAVGISVHDGAVKVTRTHPGSSGSSYLPLASGVVVIELDAHSAQDADLRMLAALIGLSDLLLDRRRAVLEAERNRGLEASDRLKAAILSSLSHELKSPIASLRAGLTALAAPKAGLESEQRELLVDLDRQANRLDRMVGDMLALSRLEAGFHLETEPHRLAELLGSSTRQLRARLAAHRLTIELSDDLPAVEVDEMQAVRVLINLLENALEWAAPGGAIDVGAAVRGSALEVWVENEGPPIPTGDLDRVFDTFWTRRLGGSGLGLAICKRVVEAHGGKIRVENRRRGPRFIFTLPTVPAQVEQ